MEAQNDHDTFQNGDGEAGHTFRCTYNDIKKGGYIILKGFPCQVIHMCTTKTGRHGHPISLIVAVDIFTGNKYQDVVSNSDIVDVPFVKRSEVELIDIGQDGIVTYIGDDGENRDDLKIPEAADQYAWVEELKKADEEGKSIWLCVVEVMGIESIVSFRESSV